MTPQDLLRLHPFFSAMSAWDVQELLKRIRLSHAELAAMLGVSRERLSMQLAAWSDKGSAKGILDQGRGHLVVRDTRAPHHVIARG